MSQAIAAAAQPSNLSFRLLTLNAHKGFSFFNRRFVLGELREAVHALSADVVFLQEVLGSHARHAVRFANWPAVPQYEYLADTIWTDFAYGRNAVYTEGHHGNAVLSKFPIVRYENHDISIHGRERRGILHCILKVPGRGTEIHALCTHLALREAHRRQQMERLCRLVAEAVPPSLPLFVAGDFNDWRQRADAVLGGCGLREAFCEAHGQPARTFPARWPLLRLDRIYYRNARVRNPAVHSVRPWSHLSDHAPLSAEVEL